MTTTEIAGIVAKLTKAGKDNLLAVGHQSLKGRAIQDLLRLGLVEYQSAGGMLQRQALTPLGLTVRAALQEAGDA